jgi:hypothetical protein
MARSIDLFCCLLIYQHLRVYCLHIHAFSNVISTFHQFVTSIYICDASVLAVFMQKKEGNSKERHWTRRKIKKEQNVKIKVG